MRILFLPILISSILSAGCKLTEPGDVGFDTGQSRDGKSPVDKDISCDGTAALSAPKPSPTPPAQYAYKILPIRGSAVGASHVGAEATSGSSKLTSVGSSGMFCIEVDLVKGTNSIKLYGLNKNGCQGKMSQPYAVTYTPIASPDAGSVKPANQAKGKPISSNSTLKSGSLSNVNDGSATTQATFSFSDIEITTTCNQCAWVKIDLGKAYTLTQFRIKWGANAGTDYGKWFTILTAKSTPAKNPDCSTNAGWTVTHNQKAGGPNPKPIIVQPVAARYAVLQMCENNGTGTSETFKLAEFEAWGVDLGATTPPLPDRCK